MGNYDGSSLPSVRSIDPAAGVGSQGQRHPFWPLLRTSDSNCKGPEWATTTDRLCHLFDQLIPLPELVLKVRGIHSGPCYEHPTAIARDQNGQLRWVVEDGAIVGSQDRPGNGGIVLTDRSYGDFEVALEMNNDSGPDSGLF